MASGCQSSGARLELCKFAHVKRLSRILTDPLIAELEWLSLQHHRPLQPSCNNSSLSALLVRHSNLQSSGTREEHDRCHKLLEPSMLVIHAADHSIEANNHQTQKRSDIRRYLEIFRPKAAPVADTFPIVPIANASDNQGPLEPGETPSIEGDMDGELVIGISWPTSFMAFSTGGSPPFLPDLATPTNTNEPYLEWQNYLLAQDTLPQVITTSYGDFEQTIPVPYMTRVCEGFEKLAARGVSVIFSSGDTGVGPSDACISNSNSSQSMFLPAFPASCPWVTAVGATQDFEPEVAVSAFGSGAGFSNHFAMPDYQVDAVNGYLEKIGDLHAGLYNRSGRTYPDVAAQGVRIAIVTELRQIAGAGTSASAPIFAAVIALVNDARLAAGKPVLGFLNPWIYGGAFAAFTDVKDGSSVGCDTDGFPAADGWDAVTGFGTPVSATNPAIA